MPFGTRRSRTRREEHNTPRRVRSPLAVSRRQDRSRGKRSRSGSDQWRRVAAAKVLRETHSETVMPTTYTVSISILLPYSYLEYVYAMLHSITIYNIMCTFKERNGMTTTLYNNNIIRHNTAAELIHTSSSSLYTVFGRHDICQNVRWPMIERRFGSSAAANDLRLLNAPSPVDFIVHVLLPNAFYTCYDLGGGVTKLKDSERQNIFFQFCYNPTK